MNDDFNYLYTSYVAQHKDAPSPLYEGALAKQYDHYRHDGLFTGVNKYIAFAFAAVLTEPLILKNPETVRLQHFQYPVKWLLKETSLSRADAFATLKRYYKDYNYS